MPVADMMWQGELVQAVANEYVVRFTHDEVKTSEMTDSLRTLGYADAAVSNLGGGQFALIETAAATFEQLEAWATQHADVLYLEPNFVHTTGEMVESTFPGDPNFSSLWGLNNVGQTGGTGDADIDAPEAWDLTTGSSDVVIAVIDTGIDYTHADLAANTWTNPGEIAGDGIDNDGNGYIDDVVGYDFRNNDANPTDGHGHGTHCAGTIGGVSNATGVVGVNWSVSLMALKFLSDDGWGSTADAIDAINYATMMRRDYGVNVVATSNSWGGGGYSTALRDAIAGGGREGILFIAAAGNDSADTDSWGHYPSSYNVDAVISVAATNHNDNLASFSNYGATTVDLAAPGVSIYSTVPGGYASYSGTSMATPYVAGVVGLLAGYDPAATAAEIKDAIMGGVDIVAGLGGTSITGGRLNAYQSLRILDGSDFRGPTVTDITPGLIDSPVSEINVMFSENLDPASVTAAAFELVEAGADGRIGTGDDTAVAITAGMLSMPTAGSVRITFAADLATGTYQLTIHGTGASAVTDAAGNGLNDGSNEVYQFQLAAMVDETESNDTLALADDVGVALGTQVIVSGQIGGANGGLDVDVYVVNVAGGQTVRADVVSTGGSTEFYVRLFDAWHREITFTRGGVADGSPLQWGFDAAGAYYLAVSGLGNINYTPALAFSGVAGDTGDYALIVSLQSTVDGGVSEADGFGYMAAPVDYSFEDIEDFGQAIRNGYTDDSYAAVASGSMTGFNFDFYGQAVTSIYASTNGVLTIGSGILDWSNTDMTTLPEEATISPFWDDLVLDSGQGSVLWAMRGGGSDRRLIIQWNDVRFYGGWGDGTVTFQTVLYEADDLIRFNYLDLDVSNYHADGASATVGIKDVGDQAVGESLLQVSINDGPNDFVGTGKSAVIVEAAAPTLTTVAQLGGATQGHDFTLTYDMLMAASDAADPEGKPISFLIESVPCGTLTKNGQAVTPGVTLLSTGESLVWRTDDHNGVLTALTVRAWNGLRASATEVVVHVDATATSGMLSFGEVGHVDALSHVPQTILLGREYINPVVFVSPPSFVGANTSIARITDVQSDRFTVWIDESPNQNGRHTHEQVSYAVFESGTWALADGTLLEVGTVDTAATVGKLVSNAWESVFFSQPFDAAPVVLSQIQTTNDATWVKTRQQSTTAGGFLVAMEEAESSSSVHGSETIGYLAISLGGGEWTGVSWQAGSADTAANHSATTLTYGQTFGSAPLVVASMSSANGPDSAALRLDARAASWMRLHVEEDTTYDRELSHTRESVDFIAFGQAGLLTGTQQAAPTLTSIDPLAGATQGEAFTITYAMLAGAANDADADGDTISFRIESVLVGTLTKDGQAVVGGQTLLSAGEELVWQTEWRSGDVGAFTVKAYDGTMASRSAVTVRIDTASNGSSQSFGEVGQVAALSHDPQTIVLSNSYVNPVVFASPVTFNGWNMSVVRVAAVQADRFTMWVDEAPNHNGRHVGETITYAVVEAGVWQLADGTVIEAGVVSTDAAVGARVSNNWEAVTFDGSFASAPAVLSQVQTTNDSAWVKTRQSSITSGGMLLAMEGAEAESDSHGAESVGYVAVTGGQGSIDGVAWQASLTSRLVGSNVTTVGFSQSFGSAPLVLASLSSYVGANNAHLRMNSVSAASMQMHVEEDTTLDAELAHVTEQISFVALGAAGMLTGSQIGGASVAAAAQPMGVRMHVAATIEPTTVESPVTVDLASYGESIGLGVLEEVAEMSLVEDAVLQEVSSVAATQPAAITYPATVKVTVTSSVTDALAAPAVTADAMIVIDGDVVDLMAAAADEAGEPTGESIIPTFGTDADLVSILDELMDGPLAAL